MLLLSRVLFSRMAMDGMGRRRRRPPRGDDRDIGCRVKEQPTVYCIVLYCCPSYPLGRSRAAQVASGGRESSVQLWLT